MAGGMFVGGGMVAVTIVLACVALATSEIQLHRRPFLRDVAFYLIACAAIFLLLIFRCISLWEPLLLLALYGIYVVVVGMIVERLFHTLFIIWNCRTSWRCGGGIFSILYM